MRHDIVGQMLLFRLRSRLANYLQSAIESSTSSTPAISAQNGEAAPVTRSVNNSPKDMRRACNSVGISDGNADCPARRPLPRNSEYQFQVARFQAGSCGDSVYSLTYLDKPAFWPQRLFEDRHGASLSPGAQAQTGGSSMIPVIGLRFGIT